MSLSNINYTSKSQGHLHTDLFVTIHYMNVQGNKSMEFKVRRNQSIIKPGLLYQKPTVIFYKPNWNTKKERASINHSLFYH